MNLDITPFLPLISGAVGGATSVGLFKGPIQTLEDWWYVTYGHNLSETAALLKEKQALNVEKMRDETLNEATKILPENIQEPKLNILGPALEASKYYIEEEELRNMFAKLIASSMDKSKSSQVHPSFVEVIKQMSSKEAFLLKNLKAQNPFGRITLVNSHQDNNINSNNQLSDWSKETRKTIFDCFYVSETNKDFIDNAFSMSALSRLGLIKIDTYITLADDSEYKYIEENFKIFDDFKNNEIADWLNISISPTEHFNLQKGSISLTEYGISFCRVCFK